MSQSPVPVADVAWLRRWMDLTAERFAADVSELTELDEHIGDGDHGRNMQRGFAAIAHRLRQPEYAEADVPTTMQAIAATLMAQVGGISGPLLGSAFLRAAKVAPREVLQADQIVTMLEAMTEAVMSRGGAAPGDKTMVDAFLAAVEAAEISLADGGSITGILAAGATGAKAGADATADMLAVRGRASHLGERSLGVRDPGAVSVSIMLDAASAALDAEVKE